MDNFNSDWPPQLIDLLRLLTRRNQFDFEKTSSDLRVIVASEERFSSFANEITSTKCRNIFAADFSSYADSRKQQEEVERASAIQDSKNIAASVSHTMSMAHNLSNATFEETMAFVQSLEEENEKKKLAIFKRVLSSMSSERGDAAGSAEVIDDEYAYLKSVFEESRKKREVEALERERRAKEAQEQRALNEQREALRRRFDSGSEDAAGVNPLEDASAATSSATSSKSAKPSDPDADEDEGGPVVRVVPVFNMEDLLATPEFDSLLMEVEHDLQFEVAEENSELSEVLAFLDKTAKSSPKPIPASKAAQPKSPTKGAPFRVHSTAGPAPARGLDSSSSSSSSGTSNTDRDTSSGSSSPAAPGKDDRGPAPPLPPPSGQATSRAPPEVAVTTSAPALTTFAPAPAPAPTPTYIPAPAAGAGEMKVAKGAENIRQGQGHDGRGRGRGGAPQGGGRGGVGGRAGRGRASNAPSEETARVSAGGGDGDDDQEDCDEDDDDDDWAGARRRLKAQAGTAEAPPGTTFAFWAGSHVGEGSIAGRRIASEAAALGGRGVAGGGRGVAGGGLGRGGGGVDVTGKGDDDDDSSDDSDDEPLHQYELHQQQEQEEHEQEEVVGGAAAAPSVSAPPPNAHTLANTSRSQSSEPTGADEARGQQGQQGMQGMQGMEEAAKGEAHVHVSGSLLSGGGRRSRVGGSDPMEGGLVRKGTRTRSLLG